MARIVPFTCRQCGRATECPEKQIRTRNGTVQGDLATVDPGNRQSLRFAADEIGELRLSGVQYLLPGATGILAHLDGPEPGRRDTRECSDVLRESDRPSPFSVCGLPQSLPRIANYAQQTEFPMAIQIVMDRTGDTRHRFDAGDRAAVEEAKKRFMELTEAGFTAAVRTGPGEQRIIRSFDPAAEETLFHPRLVGG
jgi:hypothetical protein